MFNGKSNKKAFSLIELLVVIAIISLLLAIIVPSLNKVKHLASGVHCQSNQRQLMRIIPIWSVAILLVQK